MSKITGIIAEFNPFHSGHKYLLERADGLKIVAMSGNFMQRGEPAIFDKWARAQMALSNGADIVVELPTLVSVQSADFFAKGAVDILSELGINQLIFGSESDTDYNQVAKTYAEQGQKMEAFIKNLSDELSYPQKTQLMWQEFLGLQFDGNTPNHVLALAYAKAVAEKNIQLKTIQRTNDFHSSDLQGQFASATAIRENIHNWEKIKGLVPENLEKLYDSSTVSWEDYFPLLKYKVFSSGLSEIYQVNEEMMVRIKREIKKSENIDELVENIHTKRYTKSRVRRLLIYILLNVPQNASLPDKLHVLGFTKNGQEHLSTVKDKIITRIGAEAWDSMTQKADEIYCLGNKDLQEQNYGRKPIIL
ncbi:MAG: nucleotidyltransferase [Streptococcaceae bacterium]|nr:nucleotidyltransferase [Streptococcaceae bacterium]